MQIKSLDSSSLKRNISPVVLSFFCLFLPCHGWLRIYSNVWYQRWCRINTNVMGSTLEITCTISRLLLFQIKCKLLWMKQAWQIIIELFVFAQQLQYQYTHAVGSMFTSLNPECWVWHHIICACSSLQGHRAFKLKSDGGQIQIIHTQKMHLCKRLTIKFCSVNSGFAECEFIVV